MAIIQCRRWMVLGGLSLALSLVVFPKASAQSSNDMTAVMERLQALEAEAEIRRRLDEYMDYLDAADWDGYVQFFTADGALDMDEGVVTGRAAIHKRMADATARMAAASAGRTQRQSADLLSNIRVDVQGDTANAQSRFTFLSEDNTGRFHVTGSGVYSDVWVREDGAWRIQRRQVEWDMLASRSTPSN